MEFLGREKTNALLNLIRHELCEQEFPQIVFNHSSDIERNNEKKVDHLIYYFKGNTAREYRLLKKIQSVDMFKSNLNKISKERSKSEQQKSELKNIRCFTALRCRRSCY